MTLHSLVLISDSFSCNCNSIQSPVSIVHLRVNLILSHPLLRLYINYSISNANHFQLAQQCIQISTRINSSSVHTYIFVCFTLRVSLCGHAEFAFWNHWLGGGPRFASSLDALQLSFCSICCVQGRNCNRECVFPKAQRAVCHSSAPQK